VAGTNEQRVREREHGGDAADAERERERARHGEDGAAPESAEAEPDAAGEAHSQVASVSGGSRRPGRLSGNGTLESQLRTSLDDRRRPRR